MCGHIVGDGENQKYYAEQSLKWHSLFYPNPPAMQPKLALNVDLMASKRSLAKVATLES